MRDPRTNPIVGDIVEPPPNATVAAHTVEAIIGNLVGSSADIFICWNTLEGWRSMVEGWTVLIRAEQ